MAAEGKDDGKVEEVGSGGGLSEAETLRDAAEKDGLLTWADLDLEATKQLLGTEDIDEQYALLGKLVGVRQHEVRPRRGVLLDFMFYNLQFSQELGFSEAQTSAFFSVMKTTLQHAGSSGGWLPLEDSFEHFKSLFLSHSVPSASGEPPVFTVNDVRKVTAFVTKSFYRHYAAYKVVFTERQQVEEWPRDAVVETPLRPLPLDEVGLVQDDWTNDLEAHPFHPLPRPPQHDRASQAAPA